MNPKQQQQQLPYYNNNLTNTKNIVYIDIQIINIQMIEKHKS